MEIVSYEIAKAAKGRDFTEYCRKEYDNYKNKTESPTYSLSYYKSIDKYYAPTYHQLIDWIFSICTTHSRCENKAIILEINEHLEFWYNLLKDCPLRGELVYRLKKWFRELGYDITVNPSFLGSTSNYFYVVFKDRDTNEDMQGLTNNFSYEEAEHQGILEVFKLIQT